MKHGFVLGKFYPPHLGHAQLIEFGALFMKNSPLVKKEGYCLHVLVATLPSDSIPGELRFDWLKKHFEGSGLNITFHFLDKKLPQYPEEDPVNFWDIWRSEIYSATKVNKFDYLFASDGYAHRLAQCLDCQFIPCDMTREHVSVSATRIRLSPFQNWFHLLPEARKYFLKRICIVGAESTGKTTICKHLADHYNTVWVPEYARGYFDEKKLNINGFPYEELDNFALGQLASEVALEKKARRFLFKDTDTIITRMYSKIYFGKHSDLVEMMVQEDHADLYIVMMPTIDWVNDGQRNLPNYRDKFTEDLISDLEELGRNYQCVDALSLDDRVFQALEILRPYEKLFD